MNDGTSAAPAQRHLPLQRHVVHALDQRVVHVVAAVCHVHALARRGGPGAAGHDVEVRALVPQPRLDRAALEDLRPTDAAAAVRHGSQPAIRP